MLRTLLRPIRPARQRGAAAAVAVLVLALAACGGLSEQEQLQQDIEELAAQVCDQLRTSSPEDGFVLLGVAGTAVQEVGGTNQQLSAALREECPEEMEYYRRAVEGIGSDDDGGPSGGDDGTFGGSSGDSTGEVGRQDGAGGDQPGDDG